MEDVKKKMCLSDIIIAEEFCFSFHFAHLYRMALSIQDHKMKKSVMVELLNVRVTKTMTY